MKMITTNQCENCEHCTLKNNGKIVKIYCSVKNKEYFYGQRIPCEDKLERKK